VLRSASSAPLFPYPVFRIAGGQVLAAAVVAAIAGALAGWHGVWSGLLGGFVNVSSGFVFAVLARLGRSSYAAGTVAAMIRAEAGKIAAIVLQLWLILTLYREVVYGAFFAAFVLTVLVTQAAILMRD
jgi:F0F1-type ATP synthase assembly protein I